LTNTKIRNTDTAYEAIQGSLSVVTLVAGASAAGASIDFFMLKSEADLSAFGAEFYPVLISGSFTVAGIAIALKLLGHANKNQFWLRIELANKLNRLSSRIDPRRK